jgi:HD superfamily phosphodiesterase
VLTDEKKKVFGTDKRRIEHALTVLDYAERIRTVGGGDALVVRAAAILHDIGIHEAERKYGSSAGKYQQIEGPPIAEKILRKSCLLSVIGNNQPQTQFNREVVRYEYVLLPV